MRVSERLAHTGRFFPERQMQATFTVSSTNNGAETDVSTPWKLTLQLPTISGVV
jgi:hypothetical protein